MNLEAYTPVAKDDAYVAKLEAENRELRDQLELLEESNRTYQVQYWKLLNK